MDCEIDVATAAFPAVSCGALVPLFEVEAVALGEAEVDFVGVGRGIELNDIVEAPGIGTRTVALGP